jgi:hypothetical protein
VWTIDQFEDLLSPRGQRALAEAEARAPTPATLLKDLEALRAEYGQGLARAAVETAMLRTRAAAKFSRASAMYFTRDGLEQATAEPVAHHRAARFAGCHEVWDLCCGIGGDLIQIARHGPGVRAADHDPVRLRMAERNAEVYGVRSHVRFEEADVTRLALPEGAWIFFDPGRREGARRISNPADYQPPLSTIEPWLQAGSSVGVKVAPGIDYDRLPWQPFEVEVVSLNGDVKETVLWFGHLARGARTATLLPSGVSLTTTDVEPIAVEPPRAFLYEPDGAVIRAHLVEHLAEQINATKIDAEIAFLSSDHHVTTPFARAFSVHDVLPFNLKHLRRYLRERGIGNVVIKKRGSPLDPQELEHALRLQGERSAVIVLTHVMGKPSVIICDVRP